MSPRPFRLIERDVRPDVREIGIEGEADLAVADRLEAALRRAAGRSQILLDLERGEFIDPATIAGILRAGSDMHGRGGRLALLGPGGQVRRMLSLTGLTTAFHPCRSE